jgi:hypothetical protein
MLHGMLNRIHALCSKADDKRELTITFFLHLQHWGYQPKHLHPLFSRDIKRAREYAINHPYPSSQQDLNQYSSSIWNTIQIALLRPTNNQFGETTSPPNKEPLSNLENFDRAPTGMERLILSN